MPICDADGQNCASPAGNCPAAQVCSGDAAAPLFGSTSADLTADGIQIESLQHRYFIVAGTSDAVGNTAISEVLIGYVLQVSPPPAVPTLSDVPTTHPFFQFVEALAASGVTGGCGGGKFCPDAALTCGQMAVFLAKALGLQWP